MSKTDPLTDGGAARLSLPFLPTLVTALMLGAASMLCREPATEPPAAPATAPAAFPAVPQVFSAVPQVFHAAQHVEAALPRAPATIAFAEQYPLSLAQPEPRAAAGTLRPSARLAAARRPCAGQHCTEAARRSEPLAAPARIEPARMTAAAKDATKPTMQVEADAGTADGLLPDMALPFAPLTRAVGEAVTLVRTGAASVGGSVSVMVDALR